MWLEIIFTGTFLEATEKYSFNPIMSDVCVIWRIHADVVGVSLYFIYVIFYPWRGMDPVQ